MVDNFLVKKITGLDYRLIVGFLQALVVSLDGPTRLRVRKPSLILKAQRWFNW
jgi:hypothetical protein